MSVRKRIIQTACPGLAVIMMGMLMLPSIQTGDTGLNADDAPSLDSLLHADPTRLHLPNREEPASLDALMALSGDGLAQVDIARMNLLCAGDLPGAEGVNMEHALTTIDAWARHVANETDRHLYRVTDPRYAEHYRHSEAFYRAEMLLQCLQIDLGVKYDLTAADSFSFKDSRVAFLHGMLPAKGEEPANTVGGTCVSMPVMYVAIGRRLGYPLKLVLTDSHVFVRWDGRDHPNPVWRERFNIEGSGEGFSSFDDEYYKTWPVAISDRDIRANGYLESLSSAEELALFFASRGHCLLDNGLRAEAAKCYADASKLDPRRPCYRSWRTQAYARAEAHDLLQYEY